MYFKKLMLLFFSVVLVFSLVVFAGCSNTSTNGTASSNSTNEASEQKVKLTIWWAGSDQFKAPLLEAIIQYQKEHPNVEVVPQWQPNFDYYDKYKIALAGKTAPDIVKIDHVFVQALGYNNQILELSQYGANDIKDKFMEATWKANMYKDNVYALPFDANTIALMYNKDLLGKAGKQPPTNYDELIDVAQAIKSLGQKDIYGYTVPVAPNASGWLTFQWLTWLWRNGGEVLNDNWTQVKFNSPEGVDALQKIVDLVDKYKVVPPNVYLEGEFYNGKVGMLDMGNWAVPTITKSDAPAKFGVTLLPKLKSDVPPYSGLGLYSLAISAQTKHPKEAYDFIKFLATNKEFQLEYAKKTNLMPSLIEAWNDDFFNTPEWGVYKEQLKYAKFRPGTPAWPTINEQLTVAIQAALTHTKTPQQALDDAAKKCNEELQKVSK